MTVICVHHCSVDFEIHHLEGETHSKTVIIVNRHSFKMHLTD